MLNVHVHQMQTVQAVASLSIGSVVPGVSAVLALDVLYPLLIQHLFS